MTELARRGNAHGDDGATAESPRVVARRRRVTSKALTTSLAIVAVLLTTGGIAAPQVLYAREAATFHELAEQVNAQAEALTQLEMQAGSEQLLLELRSAEVHGLPAKLTAFTKPADGPLSPEFKRALAEATTALSAAIAVDAVPKNHSSAAKKALTAREAEQPDPQNWFDVDADLLAFYADITPEGVEHVDTTGTVTLERVQQTKRLHATNQKLAEDFAVTVDGLSADNTALKAALTEVQELTTTEAQRVAKQIIDELAERDAEAEAAGLDPEVEKLEETKQLLADATDLQARANAAFFVVDGDGKVSGLPEGAEAPEGAMRIPGGPVVQMRYIMPKFQKLIGSYEAERKAVEEAAENAAAAEAQQQQDAETPAPETPADPGATNPEPQAGTGGQPSPPATSPPVTTPPAPGAGDGDTGGADPGGAGGGEAGDA
ncbi:hypothetical protein [Leucobacter aridicollis]|uniref:hypothetical protein n=1 Tax=Leucobacter aridicollis TaxID=283878 RepID=UPI002103FF2B|nr:hypothetical protein [Leucobacter aridicollis]UTX53532.1 hypothetical protein KI794_01895 [Leucobacter aridicollis]